VRAPIWIYNRQEAYRARVLAEECVISSILAIDGVLEVDGRIKNTLTAFPDVSEGVYSKYRFVLEVLE